MTKPTASACAANADKYLGTSYSVMDCQAFIERLLADVGINRNWAGSNAMFRDTASFTDMGTPEECKARLGCIPVGAMLGIWQQDGAPSKYKDGKGNLGHIGIKTGTRKGAVHSSSSRGCVTQSDFADKTVRNGGWNRVLLCRLLDYGMDQATGGSTMEAIVTTSGGALNVRRQASRGAALVGTIPNGTTVEVLEKTSVEWWRVTDGSVTGYCMAQYFDGGTVLSIEQRVAALESWRASMGG